MKKKHLRNWLLASSLSLILGAGIYACADGWLSYSSISSFTPEAFVDASYEPLFYAPYDKFYNGAYMDNTSMFNNEIVSDWHTYLGGKVSKELIEEFLLNSSNSEEALRSVFADWSKKKYVSSYANLDLRNTQVNNFISFLFYAKQIENYSAQRVDYWNYENYTPAFMSINEVEKIEKYYDKVKGDNNFFSNRMWFQVMKAKFYSMDKSSVISFFDKTATTQPKNTLYYRAVGYVAGAYLSKGESVKANVLYATIFDNSPVLRQVATYNYKVMTSGELTKLTSSLSDNGVKASLWAMQGYYNNSNLVEAMKEIYKIDSKSPHLNYLLTRWVNLEENAFNEFDSTKSKNKKEYINRYKKSLDLRTLNWVNEVASKPEKLDNPVLWILAGAYLDIYQGEYDRVSTNLAIAKQQAKGNNLVLDQVRLFSLMNNAYQLDNLNAKSEKTIVDDYNWLTTASKGIDAYENPIRLEQGLIRVNNYLAMVCKDQGNLVLSEALAPTSDFYKKEANVALMESFFLKKNKTPFETIVLKNYDFTLSDIYECRAINAFYNDKIDEAISQMQKANPLEKKWEYSNDSYTNYYKDTELLGNPFNGRIQDCNDCDHERKQSVKYSKLSFLVAIKEMQTKIANGEDVYNNALLVGNAFYNASYFGNARLFYSNVLINEDGNYISESGKRMLMNMSLVSKYYGIAKKAANTNEQKAKMAYLQAKVERNDYYRNTFFTQDYYYGGYGKAMIKPWKGFDELSKQYSETKYYQEVIKECGYFRTYLGK